jgi:predicted MFS family arabinose efflux permease
MGMAVAGLAVAVFAKRIDRGLGILVSLALLSIPTALLAVAPDLTTFTVLRIAQGLCMASAFTLMLAYLGEECSAMDAGGAFAAYITGNVASNLIGRLVSAGIADHLGLASNFYFFAVLNLAGAVLVYFTVAEAAPMEQTRTGGPLSIRGVAQPPAQSTTARVLRHRFLHPVRLHRNVYLRQFRSGTSAPVARPDGTRLRLFRVPALGRDNAVGGPERSSLRNAADIVGLSGAGRGRFAASSAAQSPAVLLGMVLIGVGTFFAQATATGFVSRAATADRGSASGIYLACYFAGGLVGTAVLGQIFDRIGWPACRRNCAVARRRLASRYLPENAHRQPTPI